MDPERLVYDIEWSIIEIKQPDINPLEQTADGESSDKSSEIVENLDKYINGK